MKVETIITLEDGEKYYLADMTEQNGIRYFLGNKLDENEEQTTESCVFEEAKEGNEYFLAEVTDPKMLNFLAAVFTANFISAVEEIPEEES